MRLTTALTILPVISVHTLAFSWRKHDTPKLSSADVEYPALDFALMGLLRFLKPIHLFIVSQNLGSTKMRLTLCIVSLPLSLLGTFGNSWVSRSLQEEAGLFSPCCWAYTRPVCGNGHGC
jgi:hypothetical protein